MCLSWVEPSAIKCAQEARCMLGLPRHGTNALSSACTELVMSRREDDASLFLNEWHVGVTSLVSFALDSLPSLPPTLATKIALLRIQRK